MKVQLVTHSIIPNLNSRLVPINPIGLVTLFSLYLDFTAESVVQCQPAVINPLQTYLYLGSNLLGPSFFLGKFPWIKFYLDQFSVGSILLWVNFPLGRFAFGPIYFGPNFIWNQVYLGQFVLGQISVGQWYFGTGFLWVNFLWVNFLLGQVTVFWVQMSLGQFTLDPNVTWDYVCLGYFFWVKFLLDNDTLGQVSFGSISFGSIFCWVKLPFFGFKCPWVNLPWAERLGPNALDPFTVHRFLIIY